MFEHTQQWILIYPSGYNVISIGSVHVLYGHTKLVGLIEVPN